MEGARDTGDSQEQEPEPRPWVPGGVRFLNKEHVVRVRVLQNKFTYSRYFFAYFSTGQLS